jgi:hypothetical protein
MGFNENFNESGLTASLRDVYHKQSIFYRNLRECAERDLGSSSVSAIEAGLNAFGRWRATKNKIQPAVVVAGQSPKSWLENWECADLLMFCLDPAFEVRAEPGTLSVIISGPPEIDYFEGRDQAGWISDFWDWTLAGLSAEYDTLTVSSNRTPDGRWTVTFRGDNVDEVEEIVRSARSALHRPIYAVELTRQSSVHNGALYFFLARAIIAQFDASGEASVRNGVRAIGRERGLAMRENHIENGWHLDMRTEMENWDGPLVSVWQWQDEGTLTPNAWKQDCTWCPYAAAWSEFGAEGQALCYLYDLELHTTMYNTYLPGTTVRWETLKTRGDSTCGFRIEASDEAIRAANQPKSSSSLIGQ